MAKKLLALLVAAMMLVGLVPAAAFARVAEEPATAEIIDTVEINGFTPPVWGAAPDNEVSIPEDAHYTLANVFWYITYPDGINGLFPEDGLFDIDGARVNQSYRFVPEEGYEFTQYPTLIINGGTEYAGTTNRWSDGMLAASTIDFLLTEPGSEDPYAIHEADVSGFVNPTPGMTGAEFLDGLAVPEGAHYQIYAVETYDTTDNTAVYDSTVLIEGHTYEIGVTLVPVGDYYFWHDAALTANGGDLALNPEYSGVISANQALIVIAELTCAEPPQIIDTVEINGFTPPVWGAAPDNEVSIPEDAHYTLANVFWYITYSDGTNGLFPEDGLFDIDGARVNQSYRFVPEEGYEFTQYPTLIINGGTEYAGTTNRWSDGMLAASTIEFLLTEPDPLPGLDEALNVEGGTIHFESEGTYPWIVVEEDGRIFAKSGNEGVASSTSTMTANVTVDAGDQLSFEFKAWGEGTGTFWDHCDFYVGSERVLYYGAYDNDWEIFTYTFETAGDYTLTWSYTKDSSVNKPGDCFSVDNVQIGEGAAPELIPIHEIYINGFEDPVAGDLPADHRHLTIPDGANYSFYDQQEPMCWFNSDGYEINTAFVEGEYYSEGGMVMANEGYYFADDCVFYLDGTTENTHPMSWVDSGEFPTLAMGIHTPVLCGGATPPVTVIDTIYVNDLEIPPVAGEAADDHLTVTIPEGEPYTLEYIRWFDEDAIIGFHDDFVEGGHYSINISVGLPEGYEFAPTVTVYINGQTDLASEYAYNYGNSYSFYTIPFECVGGSTSPIAITSVNVNGFIAPVAGETAAEFLNLSVEDGVHYQIAEIEGYDMTDGAFDIITPETVFLPGHSYLVGCNVLADEGYYFADDCEFFANGGTELVNPEFSGVYTESLAGVTSIIWTVEESGPQLIDLVEIDDLTIPAWGEHPDFDVTVPADAHYTVSYVWWTYYDEDMDFFDMYPEDVFNDPTMRYYATIELTPDEGWEFSRDCVVYINGGEELVDFALIDPDLMDAATINFTVEDPGEPPVPTMHGDVDLNGTVEIADAILAMRYQMGLMELGPESLEQAEVTGNDTITIGDAILIMRYAMGIIDHFPIEG